jgi:hypothetical protein
MKLLEVVQKFETTELFIAAVNEQLKKLMEENPEFIYNDSGSGVSCYYNRGPDHNPTNCKGCIFGQALKSLGWNDYDELDCQQNITGLFRICVDFDFSYPSYWLDIQADQDIGHKWGDLLKYLPKD